MCKKLRTFLVAILMMVSAGQLETAQADGPYRGKVIDAETKEPIEGAVVVAVWMKRIWRLADTTEVFAEAKESLTDKNGEFVIPGYKWTSIFFFLGVQPPQIFIFKPGYGDFPWHQVSPNPKQSKAQLLEPFKIYGLVELPKLTSVGERIKVYTETDLPLPISDKEDSPIAIPSKKVQNFMRLKDIERTNLESAFRTTFLYVDGPYTGKVIDATTKEPIDGAVVVAVWMNLDDHILRFEEAKETLTDKNGEFTLPGHATVPIGPFPGTQPPKLYIFKPGYGAFPWYQVYPRIDEDPIYILDKLRFHMSVELPRTTVKEERIKVLSRLMVDLESRAPDQKVPIFKKMISMEKNNLGITRPIPQGIEK